MQELRWTVLCDAKVLDLQATLAAGQTFRWSPLNSAAGDAAAILPAAGTVWRGIIKNEVFDLQQTPVANRGHQIVARDAVNNCPATATQIETLKNYFTLDQDLDALINTWLTLHPRHALTKQLKSLVTMLRKTPGAAAVGDEGLLLLPHRCLRARYLRQDPIEMIFSFLCSSNNHVKRIASMIQTLASYGQKIGKSTFCAFPTAAVISTKCTEARLRELKFGYRAKYIVETAKAIAKEGDAAFVKRVKDASLQDARAALMQLSGLGRKVSDCVLAYGFGRQDLCPMDTHMIQIVVGAQNHDDDDESSSSDNDDDDDDDDKKRKKKKKRNKPNFKPSDHDEAQEQFRYAFGPFAAWTQYLMFVSRVSGGVLIEEAAAAANTKKTSGTRRGRRNNNNNDDNDDNDSDE